MQTGIHIQASPAGGFPSRTDPARARVTARPNQEITMSSEANHLGGAAVDQRRTAVQLRRTAMDAVDHTHDRVETISIRVSALTERICGPSPETAGQGCAPLPDGYLPRIVARHQSIDEMLNGVERHLEQIAQELG